MSVTEYVVGLIDDGKRMERLINVYDECRKLGIKPPSEISEIVEGENYIEGLGKTTSINSYSGGHDTVAWTIIKLDEIPKGIHAVAFIQSY